ncbi:MAG: hypothetical protein JOY77_10645 [Alphaproteobacteria bacterium]|nr:hypothetical protein [Alphaproteobacteria bacterium]
MALQDAEPSELESALPAHPQKRDALGQFCFIIHFLPLMYVVSGWLAPWRGALIFYLVFLPAMFLQWKLNKSSCVLNNIESLIRTGRWRNPANREEGAWLRTLVNGKTGWNLSRTAMDIFINGVMVLFWLLALARLRAWV